MNLIQMSISGAVLIAVIAAVRALAINKLPKKTFLVLWGIVIVRLLVPYSLPSAFSIYSLPGRLTLSPETADSANYSLFALSSDADSMKQKESAYPVDKDQLNQTEPEHPANTDSMNRKESKLPGDTDSINQTESEFPAVADQLNQTESEIPADTDLLNQTRNMLSAAASSIFLMNNALRLIWAVGALVCSVYFTVTYFLCRWEFRESLPVDNGFLTAWLNSHRICRIITVRQSDRISAPLTYGVFRPVILLPRYIDWNDKKTLSYVLTHEYIHICRFDVLMKLALTSALCIHWFNPAVWVMRILANRDIELSCDEGVLRLTGEQTKAAYAMALIKMEEDRSNLRPLCNNFSKNAVEERIIAIMKTKKTSQAAVLAAFTLIAGVTTVFATTATPRKPGMNNKIAAAVQSEESDSTEMEYTENNTAAAMQTEADDSMEMTYAENNTAAVQTEAADGTEETYAGNTIAAVQIEAADSIDPAYSGLAWGFVSDEKSDALSSDQAEWWTAEEYEKWLEHEKSDLQSIIGSRSWNPTDGWYTWTQEKVDETISQYEQILKEIQSGGVVSKPQLMADGTCVESGDISDFMESFARYEPFGLTFVKSGDFGNIYWDGELVEVLVDNMPDGNYTTISSSDEGGIKVQTVYDSDGKLVGIKKIEE